MIYKKHINNYLKEGMKIFPCAINGTVPMELDSYESTLSKNEAECHSDFQYYDNCNIGAITGKQSNLIVVETDMHGDIKDGLRMLEILQHGGERSFNTRMVTTPFGGVQYHFSYPDNIDSVRTIPNVRNGVNIQADGGYAIMPGSDIHGSPYTFEDINTEVAVAPKWLVDLIMDTENTHKNDSISSWITDCCVTHNNPVSSVTTVKATELYESYKWWTRSFEFDEGYPNQTEFHRQMHSHGYTKKRTSLHERDDIYVGLEVSKAHYCHA